ncbi:MAG: tetratricopeptide repeat protein [Planctomycetota bacterium]
MPRIILSAIAQTYGDDPTSGQLVCGEDLNVLHGMHSEQLCWNELSDALQEVVKGGGRVRFVYDEVGEELRVTTIFEISRGLTEAELEMLVEETFDQWADGIGATSFHSYRGEVLSMGLAQAIQESGQSKFVGELFVDAFPPIDDRDLVVHVDDLDSPDAELIQDLIAGAEAGDSQALVDLGQRYEAGEGLAKDEKLAFQCYHDAAQAENVNGSYLTGLSLWTGMGVEENPERAFTYFQKAAAGGIALALQPLGTCFAGGFGVEPDEDKAIACYEKGAKLGDADCIAELGDCYEFGTGVEPDRIKALEFYQRALDAGCDEAQEAIARLKAA